MNKIFQVRGFDFAFENKRDCEVFRDNYTQQKRVNVMKWYDFVDVDKARYTIYAPEREGFSYPIYDSLEQLLADKPAFKEVGLRNEILKIKAKIDIPHGLKFDNKLKGNERVQASIGALSYEKMTDLVNHARKIIEEKGIDVENEANADKVIFGLHFYHNAGFDPVCDITVEKYHQFVALLQEADRKIEEKQAQFEEEVGEERE